MKKGAGIYIGDEHTTAGVWRTGLSQKFKESKNIIFQTFETDAGPPSRPHSTVQCTVMCGRT